MLQIVELLFEIYSWLIIAYIFMSWLPQLKDSQVGDILAKIVEPYLAPFRKFIPPIGMIDISPIVAILALAFIEIGVVTLLEMLLR